MENDDKLVKIYSGSKISAGLLKEILETNNIATIVRDELQTSLSSGYADGGLFPYLDIYVQYKDLEVATSITNDFKDSL